MISSRKTSPPRTVQIARSFTARMIQGVCGALFSLGMLAVATPSHADGNYKNPYDAYTYSIYRNQWGDPSSEYGSESISVPDVGGDFWSSTWAWKTTDPNSWVTAYPEAVLTANGSKGIAIWNLSSLPSYWSYGVNLNGSYTNAYDVAYDIYISGATSHGSYNTTEVMIWMDWANTGPIGSKITTYTDSSNRVWDVYYGTNSTEPVYSFLAEKQPLNAATLSLPGFFNWMVYTLPYIDSSVPLPSNNGRLTTIDTGVEIHEGAGTLTTYALTNAISTSQNPNN